MCGIFGIIGEYDEKKALNSLKILQHRGPDNSGHYKGKDLFLGHTRLSIIDLSTKADQPMKSADGTVILSFNGEIYNYKELKEQIAYAFSTSSDTEVVLASYIKWGKEFVSKLNGMFAIALWDARERRLLLYRDRFGKKPVYYAFHNSRFIFSSEIKAILPHLHRRPEINKTAFLQYLSFLASLPPHTMFEGIHKLPAGHCLEFSRGAVKLHRYYDILDRISTSRFTDTQTVLDELECILAESVKYRQVADVEVGSFLSGGIDSTLVSALYSKSRKEPVHTFSIGYAEYKDYDELEYAEMAVKDIHSVHHPLVVHDGHFTEVMDEVVYHLDEPINDPACIPTYLLAKHVKECGIKAVLTGEGSDEIFLGYDLYFEIMKYASLQGALEENQKYTLLAYFLDNFNLSRRWEYFKRSFSDKPVYRTIGEGFTDRQKIKLLNPEAFPDIEDDQSYRFIRGYHERFRQENLVAESSWMSYIDLRIWIAEVLMMKVDKMTMAHSVEARAPFLDYRLVEFVFGVDAALREGSTNKALLKALAEKYIAPEIIHRKKKGFSSPHLEWYYRRCGGTLLNDLKRLNRELGWFDGAFLEFLYNEGKEKRFKQHIWALIVFARWYNKFYR